MDSTQCIAHSPEYIPTHLWCSLSSLIPCLPGSFSQRPSFCSNTHFCGNSMWRRSSLHRMICNYLGAQFNTLKNVFKNLYEKSSLNPNLKKNYVLSLVYWIFKYDILTALPWNFFVNSLVDIFVRILKCNELSPWIVYRISLHASPVWLWGALEFFIFFVIMSMVCKVFLTLCLGYVFVKIVW